MRSEIPGLLPTAEAYKKSGIMLLNDLLLLRHKTAGNTAVDDAFRDTYIEAQRDNDTVTEDSAEARGLAKLRKKIADRAGEGKKWVQTNSGEELFEATGDEIYRYAVLQSRRAISNLINSVTSSPSGRRNPETISQALKIMREHIESGGNVQSRLRRISRWDAAAAKKSGKVK